MSRRVLPARAVTVLLVWSLGAFGGVYPWAALPIAFGAALVAILTPPRFGGSASLRQLDAALLLFLVAAASSLVPLPAPIVAAMSPRVPAFDEVYRVDAGLAGPIASGAHALSLSPASTAYALVVASGVVLIFWAARTSFAGGGTRRVARAVSWLGLLMVRRRTVGPDAA